MEPVTNVKHATVVQAWNNSSSANSQKIPASMENGRPEGNEHQYVTYPS